jgi:hypothetical protein
MSLFARDSLARKGEVARQFAKADPFRHVVIPGFLDADLAQRLLQGFPSFEDRYALNEMGEVGGKAVRMDVRNLPDAYQQLDAFLQSQEFLDYVSAVTGIPGLLYDPDYIGGGTHENCDGQSLDVHVDFNYHPRTKTHRRLNLIIYLNHDWQESWGGTLDLHSDPWSLAQDRVVRVEPLFNRAVIFETTESSWHGFSPITLPPEKKGVSRKSFAIYLYTKDRPRAETAPPHATIYVPDAMPAHLLPGVALQAGDVSDLQARFTRLRTQLRFLYDREKYFGAQMAVMEQAIAEMRAAQKLELQGYATQQGIEGLWSDNWAGREVTLRLTPTRLARGLSLQLWAPPALTGRPRLQIAIRGIQSEHLLRPAAATRVDIAFDGVVGQSIELHIKSDATWVPATDGASGDDRALAYRVIGAELLHEERLPLFVRLLRKLGLSR